MFSKDGQEVISIRKERVDMVAYIAGRQEFFLVQELVTRGLIDRDLAFRQNHQNLRYFFRATPNHPKDMYQFDPDGKHFEFMSVLFSMLYPLKHLFRLEKQPKIVESNYSNISIVIASLMLIFGPNKGEARLCFYRHLG